MDTSRLAHRWVCLRRGVLGGLSRVGTATVLIVAAVCWPLIVALLTVYSTVQQPSYYQQAFTEADVYNRLYTQVLTDPQVVDLTTQLLARLPVPRTVVVDNLRVVVPPAALRGVTDRLAAQVAGYLAGDGDRLDLRVDLRPVFANIARLVSVYLVGQVSAARSYQANDIARLVIELLAALAQISRGQPPAAVPWLPLRADQANTVANVILSKLPPV